jgi:ABC-2 type transport system permease protein
VSTFFWLIRREFWENRAFWLVPSSISVLLILAALFGRVDLRIVTSAAQTTAFGGMLLGVFGVAFLLVMSLYSTWYLVDCLYAERRDGSILFWKSLPVTDTAAVLAKLATALIVIPLVYFIAADITTLLIAFILSLRAGALVEGSFWHADLWLQLQVTWLYLIITIAIWYLPVAAWLMLISAWAKRSVTLWALLVPLAAHWAARAFFGTNVIGNQIMDRLVGFAARAFHLRADGARWPELPGNVAGLFNPGGFLTSPATWIGVAVGIALILCTIRIRSRSAEI